MTTPMQGTKTRKTPFQREMDAELEAMRDDCVALFINSGLKQKEITAKGGPTPSTITKWLYKETMFPRYHTISSFVAALGCKMVIVDSRQDIPQEVRTKVARAHAHRRPRMPIRKLRASQKRAAKT